MSVAKQLPEIHPFFIYECVLCGRLNRVVVKGIFRNGDKIELHPDMGYAFCNCKDIFYTKPEFILNSVSYEPDKNGTISLPDPFFAWPDPYQFLWWDVRRYLILWDMDSFQDHLIELGYEVLSAVRDFDVHSKTPQHFHIKVKIRGI